MDLTKPLGTIATVPVKVVGRTVGLVRGTARAVARVVGGGEREESAAARADSGGVPPVPPHPAHIKRTQPPGDLPTPADVADNVAPPGEVTTPAGTTGADVGYNPDTAETDLHQPGTEPLMDPATTKAVSSEAETLRRAAERDKG